MQPTENKQNGTTHSQVPFKAQNVTAKSVGTKSPIQTKRSSLKHHDGNRTAKNNSTNAVSRQMNIENFVDNHKAAIVRLLKKLLLPKLSGRALEPRPAPLESDPTNKNLDKEAMTYELGYFLGLQKAFKNREMLMGDSGEQNLVPLKLVHNGGSKAAVSDSGPMTGFTSVSLPFHNMKTSPVHESLESSFSRYGARDPGFLKKITRADERDILQFAGKHNMDVFAERNNLRGIGDYLAKRNFINRPAKAAATNEGAAQRIKKNDILGPSVFAEKPDQPKEKELLARVDSGPNPLDDVPIPLHRMVSEADHLSANELEGLVNSRGGRLNMRELYGLIEADEKARESREDQDRTPQIGTVFGEDTEVVQAQNGVAEGLNQQDITTDELESLDKGQSRSTVEKRTLEGLAKIISQNQYENERRELGRVLRRIISKLSENVNLNEKRNDIYDLPFYERRGLVSRQYIPNYYYRPVYQSLPSFPMQRLWRRNVIPRPHYFTLNRRSKAPQNYDVTTEATKAFDNMNEYEYQSEKQKPADLEVTGGVEAYALPKIEENPASRIENFIATPKEESLPEAIELLNRGSSIDDSLGDHLQAGFLQRFVLPNSPTTMYKRTLFKHLQKPDDFRIKLRIRRSKDEKKKAKIPGKKKLKSKAKKNHGKKQKSKSAVKNDVKTRNKEANGETAEKGSKKHEISRDPAIPVLSGFDTYVSPAVFESRSQNFFTQGSQDNTRFINQFGAGAVLVPGSRSGIGTAVRQSRYHNGYSGSSRNGAYQRKSKALEQFIASPEMSGFRSSSNGKGHSRSTFVGNRRISPALDIYQDSSVSSNGDLPLMEVQNMKPSEVTQTAEGIQGETQQVDAQNTEVQNSVETQGLGTIETSSRYEVVKSPGMEDGSMQLTNDDLLSQQNSQIMEEPKGDERTGVNAMAVEEIPGEAKQAISNTFAVLDKPVATEGNSQLENCCQADLHSSCCLQWSSGGQ